MQVGGGFFFFRMLTFIYFNLFITHFVFFCFFLMGHGCAVGGSVYPAQNTQFFCGSSVLSGRQSARCSKADNRPR